jgi:DNA repair protein RecN (Recombination protein N)
VRRLFSAAGAGRAHVNGSPATVQVLGRVGELLVDMHGPHDHQSLLHPGFQMDLLDAFGRLWEQRHGYERVYAEFLGLQARRRELERADAEDVARQIDLLSFQVKDIEDAAPVEGEDETVEREQHEAANAQRILELADGARNALTEGEGSAFGGLAAAQKALAELAGLAGDAGAWRDEARAVAAAVQELSRTIERYARHVEADPQRLQWLENRMALYHRLKKKYGATVPEILAFLQRSRERLRDLQSRGEQLAEVDAAIARTRARLQEVGARLGRDRRAAAARLAKAVTAELRDLGFPQGVFAVGLSEAEPGPAGLDAVAFGFAPNAGEPMRPLREIASSGEISRVMLATKAVLSDHDRIPVLVFDEIDATVGGEMGRAIGAKLAAVARHHQVLCITHLPQVAVCGATHFAVTKRVSDGRTRTEIEALDESQRVEEVARMLGGRDLTSVTLRHAREMLGRR